MLIELSCPYSVSRYESLLLQDPVALARAVQTSFLFPPLQFVAGCARMGGAWNQNHARVPVQVATLGLTVKVSTYRV